MEVSKVLIVAMFVATLSSVSLSAKRLPSTIDVLVNYVISRDVANATQEMKNLYKFITSTNYIQNSPIVLPNMNTQRCSSNQPMKDKLAIAYKKLFVFRSPLYMAFSYEENQGPQHSLLVQVLRETSYYVNGSTVVLYRMMRENHFPVPTVQTGMSEGDLDQYCRGYLQTLKNNTLVNLVITDDVVKVYRNYLILYSLNDAIGQVSTCVTGI